MLGHAEESPAIVAMSYMRNTRPASSGRKNLSKLLVSLLFRVTSMHYVMYSLGNFANFFNHTYCPGKETYWE